MERNSFFGGDETLQELLNQSVSEIESERWVAAIGLAEYKTSEAARALWTLSRDSDENTRVAAGAALREFPTDVLSKIEAEMLKPSLVSIEVSIWLSKALPTLAKDTEDLFSETIQEILLTEGPTTGARLQRLLAAASGQTRSLSQAKVARLLGPLISEDLVRRVDRHFNETDLALWILNLPGQPDFVIRPRNARLLTEIPVNEARAILLADRQYQRKQNRELGFAILTEHFEIAPNELFLVGEALENQWQGLFDS